MPINLLKFKHIINKIIKIIKLVVNNGLYTTNITLQNFKPGNAYLLTSSSANNYDK